VTSAILLVPNLWLLRGRPTLAAVPVLEAAELVDGSTTN
jgi:DHA3 family tetracycline resistance protein-like MFS transporter